jgi:hypothetical protein
VDDRQEQIVVYWLFAEDRVASELFPSVYWV